MNKLPTFLTFILVLLPGLSQAQPSYLQDLLEVGQNPWVQYGFFGDDSTGIGWGYYALRGDPDIWAEIYWPNDSLVSSSRMFHLFDLDTVWVRTPFFNDVPWTDPDQGPMTGPADTTFGVPSGLWESLRVQFLIMRDLRDRFPRVRPDSTGGN